MNKRGERMSAVCQKCGTVFEDDWSGEVKRLHDLVIEIQGEKNELLANIYDVKIKLVEAKKIKLPKVQTILPTGRKYYDIEEIKQYKQSLDKILSEKI
jgi:hypothetical protein